jgi:hypothetical protein
MKMKMTRIFLVVLVVFACLKMAVPVYAVRLCSQCTCSTPCDTPCVRDDRGSLGLCAEAEFCRELC